MFSCASASELKEVPEEVQINGSAFRLDAYVWRDFTPPTDANGDPLRSTATLNLISGPEILSQVHLVRQYVVYEEEVWAADLQDLIINNSTYSGTSVNGPKWGPDVKVDVVLEFTYDGKTYRVREANVNIDHVS